MKKYNFHLPSEVSQDEAIECFNELLNRSDDVSLYGKVDIERHEFNNRVIIANIGDARDIYTLGCYIGILQGRNQIRQ